MIGVVLVTEAEQTERIIVVLIAVLLGVAVLLMGLTFWYWRYTNPRRYARQLFPEPQGPDLDLRQRYEEQARYNNGYDPSLEGNGRILQGPGEVYDPRGGAYAPPQRAPYVEPRHDPYGEPYRDPYADQHQDPYREARRR